MSLPFSFSFSFSPFLLLQMSTVVVDFGSGSRKAGFAGEGAPRAVFTTRVGHPAKKPSLAKTHSFVGGNQIKGYPGAQDHLAPEFDKSDGLG